MIYVVLGMHKSGTTLVSQILHHSGIDMGDFDESVSYDRGNKYERASVLALDMDILDAPDDEVLDLGVRGPLQLTDAQRARMREIIADGQSRHADWGFKDPRLTLVYELWAQELPEHRLIAVYRDPAEAWPRFKWRGRRLYHTNFARAAAFLDRWHEHNECLLRLAAAAGAERPVPQLPRTDVQRRGTAAPARLRGPQSRRPPPEQPLPRPPAPRHLPARRHLVARPPHPPPRGRRPGRPRRRPPLRPEASGHEIAPRMPMLLFDWIRTSCRDRGVLQAPKPGWRRGRKAKRSGHRTCPERVPGFGRMCGSESQHCMRSGNFVARPVTFSGCDRIPRMYPHNPEERDRHGSPSRPA